MVCFGDGCVCLCGAGGWVLVLPLSGLHDSAYSFLSMMGAPVLCCGCSLTFLLWFRVDGVAMLGPVVGVQVWQLRSGSGHPSDLVFMIVCALLLYRSMCFESGLCVIWYGAIRLQTLGGV